jgi:hypothetical protein
MNIKRIVIIAGVILLAAAIPIGAALATSRTTCYGTLKDDLILCTPTTSQSGAGDLGNDKINVPQGYSVRNLSGDGSRYSAVSSGNGGSDTITIDGTVSLQLSGDSVRGRGGNDVITIAATGSVGSIVGDGASVGGSDTISIAGTVVGNVDADGGSTTVGGNDTITLHTNALVGGIISGGGGIDTLVFAFSGDAAGDEVIAAILANPAAYTSGSVTYNGYAYTWSGIEAFAVQQ